MKGILLSQPEVGWAALGYVERLAEYGRVVVAPQPGFGAAGRRDAYTADGIRDAVVAAADDVDRFVAFGYSNTAALSTIIATTHPTRAAGVVCAGFDPFIDMTAATAYAEAQTAEGEYEDGATFDWRAVAAFYRGLTEWQGDPPPLRCPAVLLYGSDDPLIAPSVEANRQRLVEFGFEVVALEGLDHESCVAAADRVIDAAKHVLASP